MVERSIEEIQFSIHQNPYIGPNYNDLVVALQAVRKPLDRAKAIHETYKTKLQYFRLNHLELNDWLSAIHSIDDIIERSSLEYEFYNLIVPDYSNANTMNNYLEFCKSLVAEEIFDEDDYQNLFSKVLIVGAHDFINGNKIWINLLDFFKNKYVKSKDDEDLQALIKLHLKRLSYPHQQLEESFSEFSALISEFDNENYDERMTAANKIYSQTKSKLPYYESFEIEIKKSPNDPQLWINYMESVHKYNKHDMNAIIAIFERAIATEDSWSSDWEKVWMSVIYHIYSNEEVDLTSLNFILTKYIRTFPSSGHAYSETIRNCSTLDGGDAIENYEVIKHRIERMELMTKWEFPEWKLVVLATIQMKYQRIKHHDTIRDELGEFIGEFIDEMLHFAEQAMESNDIFHSVEKVAFSIYAKLGNPNAVRRYLTMMYEKFPNQVDVWLYVVQCLVDMDIKPLSIRPLFNKALSHATELDLPEKLTEEWLHFEQLHGDISSFEKAVVVCNEAIKKVVQKREAEQQIPELNGTRPSNKRKRKHEEVDKEPETKSREKCTVRVDNIPLDATEDTVRNFFKDCGEIGEISLVDVDNQRVGIFDFQTEQQVFTALTKSHKTLGGSEILVNRLQDALLFVNNYPSTYSQEELKDLFDGIGKVAKIRFPNQTLKRQKRFCYLQMISTNDAQKVIAEYNGKTYHDDNLGGEFSWEVQVSSPNHKHERSTPISERKARVTNISFNVTKEAFEKKFASCGDIEVITFPKAVYEGEKMKNNGGLAIVTYKTIGGLENALKLNETQFKGRKLIVVKQQSQQRPAPFEPEDFDGVRTIGLLDLDASLNFHQVRKYFEDKFGKVSKVLLIPENKQALVEFAAAADAGKVGLAEGSLDIGNGKVKVVAKEDIVKTGTSSKPTPQPTLIPTSIRRRKLK
ncbi:hypothetical protein Cantr_09014 [Candida viswanathii]|uniref:RRM domain-containing protein n=1 Tax=Candida viswanathii TaxID=5486 RepID=A0A367YAI0_9ASCO|nr:hypothetical protein Cantr_09014 [Candida viswanathii]